ncbi:acyltransferase family protein [Pseudactinotalea sp.]|uniref:acyltransferase family protein n=1 Tax=Pseudactinotalea sp. TaxID=1926260 RepID=UPI003B3AAB19
MTAATRTDQGFRPEVQGLRAVAVALVVIYHFWPTRLTGGFVGVDVFFVISGFLITSHLMREVEREGTVSLRNFWARRIRRLLPASLLVLAVCAVATYLWVLPTHWVTTSRAIVASALYVQNWALASDAVDYLAQGEAPTLVQHFWSLSVEEQFYVVWPLLLVAGLALARRFRPGLSRVRTAAIVIATVGLASFATSLVMTAREPAWAYFATPTRLWELALGAGLALVSIRLAAAPRAVLGWLGLAAIVATAVMLDGGAAFPGWVAAVPTLGTVAVIAAGTSGSRWGVDRVLSLRPARFLGDISYAVYLWHWPVVVVAPLVLVRELSIIDKLLGIGVVVLLSWGTKVWVEDRFRRPRRGVVRTYALAAAGMVLVVALGASVRVQLEMRVTAAEAVVAEASADPCFGPGAMADPEACGGPTGDGPLLVPPALMALQNDEPRYLGCQQTLDSAEVVSCSFGSEEPDPDAEVVIVGDSHGTQWFPALEAIGRERNWRIETYSKSSCPPTAAERIVADETDGIRLEDCRTWLAEVTERVRAADPDLVIVTAYSSAYEYAQPADDRLGEPSAVEPDPAVAGYASLWQQWRDQGIEVAAIAAIPRTQGESVPDCVAAHPDDLSACSTPRAEALPPDPLVAAAEETGAGLIDLTAEFCDDSTCYPVIGDLVVYRDFGHLSHEYSRALAPALETALLEYLPSG